MSEPAVWGSMHWGNFRWGLYQVPSIFQTILQRMYSLFGLPIVAWLERVSSGKDPLTGKPTFIWVESSIDVVINRARADQVPFEPGVVPEHFLRIFCLDGIKVGDQIKYKNRLFEVLAPQAFKFGSNFEYRTALVKRLKMEAEQA
jgi:hypothetical protein